LFLAVTSNYFDDFVSIAAMQETPSVDYIVKAKAVFRLLGWKFADDGPKVSPFCEILTALGVSLM
jgi:hypothetical protein